MERFDRVYGLASAILASSPMVTVGQAVTIADMIIALIDRLPKENEDEETDLQR